MRVDHCLSDDADLAITAASSHRPAHMESDSSFSYLGNYNILMICVFVNFTTRRPSTS